MQGCEILFSHHTLEQGILRCFEIFFLAVQPCHKKTKTRQFLEGRRLQGIRGQNLPWLGMVYISHPFLVLLAMIYDGESIRFFKKLVIYKSTTWAKDKKSWVNFICLVADKFNQHPCQFPGSPFPCQSPGSPFPLILDILLETLVWYWIYSIIRGRY